MYNTTTAIDVSRCHTKSVITKPQNVFVMRDIMSSGYVAGGGCQWFGGGPTNTLKKDFKAEAVQDGINKRLSGEEYGDDSSSQPSGSMLAFGCSLKETSNNMRSQVISISNRVLPWDTTIDSKGEQFPGGNTAYLQKYGLGTVHYGEDVRASESMEFITSGSVNNSLCFLGPHRKYNPFAQNFFELVPGQGHFGPDAIPGVRSQSSDSNTHRHTQLRTPYHLPLHRTHVGVVANRSRWSRRGTR